MATVIFPCIPLTSSVRDVPAGTTQAGKSYNAFQERTLYVVGALDNNGEPVTVKVGDQAAHLWDDLVKIVGKGQTVELEVYPRNGWKGAPPEFQLVGVRAKASA